MKKLRLTKEEKEIENALLSGDFKPVKGKELENIENALKSRKKDTTMTIRVNSRILFIYINLLYNKSNGFLNDFLIKYYNL